MIISQPNKQHDIFAKSLFTKYTTRSNYKNHEFAIDGLGSQIFRLVLIIFKLEPSMTDLNNLFSTQKQPPPSKRLFADSSNHNRQRSMQPLKKSRSQQTHSIRPTLSHSQLPKRTLSRQHLKKQLKLYNNRILVCLVRKVFFIMVVIWLFNFLAADFNRPLLYSNIFLALTSLKLHFDSDILGSKYYQIFSLIMQLCAFGVNFFYLLGQISNKSFTNFALPPLIVSLNASINYFWTIVMQPIVKVKQIKNMRTPYLGFIEKSTFQLKAYFQQFKTFYELCRPLITLNLAYWLLVVCYIIKSQQDVLFFNLFSFELLRASVASAILCHLFLKFVAIIDSKIGIELLSSNKKEINLNLLRMSDQNGSKNVHWEIQKYVWSSCESFWDTQFLTHHYQINYDLLEDYMTRQIEKTESSTRKCLQLLQNNSKQDKQQEPQKKVVANKWGYFVQYYLLLQLLGQLNLKVYLFYIVDQIALFQKMGTDSPISMEKIHKAIGRLIKSLNSLHQRVSVGELRTCLFRLSSFLAKTIQMQE